MSNKQECLKCEYFNLLNQRCKLIECFRITQENNKVKRKTLRELNRMTRTK